MLLRAALASLLLFGFLALAGLGAAAEPPAAALRESRFGPFNSLDGSSLGVLGPGFTFSPDSRYVVYRSPQGPLVSRRLQDGLLAEIAPPPACSNMYENVLISPDSRFVLFQCPALSGTPKELWTVPIEGPAAAAVRISLPADPPYQAHEFLFAAGTSRVLYTIPRIEPFRIDLYSVPVEGPASASVLINAPLGEGGQALAPVALPLSSRVVYLGHSPGTQSRDIWATGLTALDAVRIGVSPAAHPLANPSLVSPDEQHVVWTAIDENEDAWMFSASISDPPGATVQLHPDLPHGGEAGPIAISPDSSRVAFLSNPNWLSSFELFSVPISGPATGTVNLSGPTQPWNLSIVGAQYSPDGAWIVYLANREEFGRRDLYRVPAAGPASENLRINPIDPIGAGGVEVGWFEPIPETTDVVLSMFEDSTWPKSLRCHRGSLVGASGNATPLWTQPLPVNHAGLGCVWVEESRGVLTVAEDPVLGVPALWLAHGDGPPDLVPKKLFDSTQFVLNFDPFWNSEIEPTPDGKYVAYRGRYPGGLDEVWSLPLPFFWDGFESAGTGQWSSAQP